MDGEFDEGENSFFELELTVPDFDNNKSTSSSSDSNNNKNNRPLDKDSNSFDSREVTLHDMANKAGKSEHKFQQPALLLSPTDFLSKRKALPIEHISKSQSPISLHKSGPRFQILMFKKSKSMAACKIEKTAETKYLSGIFVDTPKNKKQESSKILTLKFKLEETKGVSPFARDNSLRKQISDDSLSYDSSKRFSKEMIQKYLKLIKLLYIKVSKRQTQKTKFSGELSLASPSSSPATVPSSSPKKDKQGNIPAGIRVVCKHLGKSKSASASASSTTEVLPSTMRRRDDSLLLQHDGIQSAILHCKKSFNSSKDSALLSRFASDPLQEKSMASPRIFNEETGIN